MTGDKKRRAVVLGGGGSKGSYEVGVWQALIELGIDYHVVTGTSVGALNGALMVMGCFDEALSMWNNLDNTQVMSEIPAVTGDADDLRVVYRAFANQMFKKGGVDVTPLEETVRRLVDEEAMRAGDIEFGIVTVEFPLLRPVEWFLPQIPQGRLADFLLASAACFPAFKPKEIDGAVFIDGGYANNIPVDLALRAETPVDEVIAVDVEGIGVVRRNPDNVPVTTLRCYWDLGNLLIFDSATCRRNIRLGYLDGMKVLGSFGGHAYTFAQGEINRLEQLRLDAVSRCCLTILGAISADGKRQISSIVAGRIVNAATRRRVVGGGELDLRGLLLASAELAAELLGLDPTLLYTAESFDAALLSAMRRLVAETTPLINALDRKRSFNLADLASAWSKEHLLAVCAHLLHRQMNGVELVAPQITATLTPREFLGAIYIEALLY